MSWSNWSLDFDQHMYILSTYTFLAGGITVMTLGRHLLVKTIKAKVLWSTLYSVEKSHASISEWKRNQDVCCFLLQWKVTCEVATCTIRCFTDNTRHSCSHRWERRMGINLRSHLAQQRPTSNNLWLTRNPRRLDYIWGSLILERKEDGQWCQYC